MKKALIASTALVLTAGIAAADVTISGYGRTGVLYQEDGVRGAIDTDGDDIADLGASDAIVQSRLRMNIDATTSTWCSARNSAIPSNPRFRRMVKLQRSKIRRRAARDRRRVIK